MSVCVPIGSLASTTGGCRRAGYAGYAGSGTSRQDTPAASVMSFLS